MSGCYKDLKAWQKSVDLTLEVYRCTQRFPGTETYGLTSQMRRAAVSIASNIAEGKDKSSDGKCIVFLSHARGSLHELETQTLIAQKLGYLQDGAATNRRPRDGDGQDAKWANSVPARVRERAKSRMT